ncbi:MAG: hypothetical protein KQJ78_11910 [Deltaproteobacteria bacterium]|nr:hypothetical protein [Deltaproteobacteria bacterium]
MKFPVVGSGAPLRKAVLRVFFLAVAGVAAACASAPPVEAPQPLPAMRAEQNLTFRVLSSTDRPLSGAKITLLPRQGQPTRAGVQITNQAGEVKLVWQPEVTEESVGTGARDRVKLYRTALAYQVDFPGYLPAFGSLSSQDRSHLLFSKELASLARNAYLPELVEVAVLHKPAELFSGELAGVKGSAEIRDKCFKFFEKYRQVAPFLGVEFSYPAFGRRGKELTLRLRWVKAAWGGLAYGPLYARMVVGAALPVAVAAGKDLLPLPGIDRLTLAFLGEQPNPADTMAAPENLKVRLSATAAQMIAYGAGRTDAEKFFAQSKLTVAPMPSPAAPKTEAAAAPAAAKPPKPARPAGPGGKPQPGAPKP